MAKCEVELLPLLEWQASLSLFGQVDAFTPTEVLGTYLGLIVPCVIQSPLWVTVIGRGFNQGG